jgi:dipeptidase E
MTPPHRGGLRGPEAAHRRRQHAGVVDCSLFPHLDHPACAQNTMAEAERWAAGIAVPAYAMDEQTAIKVADGVVVVSEGHWKLF